MALSADLLLAPGGLPANLQGLWNDSNRPPWHSDYHANINVQMNYWPAEPANLPECHLPFFDLVSSQLPAWRKAAAASTELKTPAGEITTRGFAIRTSHNTMGGLGWKWDKTANAGIASISGNITPSARIRISTNSCLSCPQRDLRVLGRSSEAIADDRLVVPNAWSPEHGPTRTA